MYLWAYLHFVYAGWALKMVLKMTTIKSEQKTVYWRKKFVVARAVRRLLKQHLKNISSLCEGIRRFVTE